MAHKCTLEELQAGFPLMVNRQTPQPPVHLHEHSFTELVIILSGRGLHYNEKDAYEIMTGNAFLVTGLHGYKDTKNLNLVNILFYHDRLALPLTEARKLPGYYAFFAIEPQYREYHKFRNCLRLQINELSRASVLIDEMEKELKEQMPGFEFIATALLMELIGLLSRAYTRMDQPTSRPVIQLSNVLSYVESHYPEPIRLKELARIAHMSESTLLRAFHHITGFAPIDYLIRLRLNRACDLLQTANLNITETAYRVGFNDSNYFTRQFRRVMGCSPKDYILRVQRPISPDFTKAKSG